MARSSATASLPRVDAAKLRRLALDAQGLLRQAPFGRGRAATLRAIEHIGYVQIDTISVVTRAHDHVLASRVPNYEPGHLDRLLADRSIFEYWYHAAAYLPMRDYRYALPRMHACRTGREHWIRSRDRKLMREVLARIAAEGPLMARDFETPPAGTTGWWNWKPAKQALEQLFMEGELMVTGRQGFQKTYDLRERVLPEGTDTRTPTDREMASHLLSNMLRAHGFATPKNVTHLRRGQAIRGALKTVLADEVEAGALLPFRLPGGTVAYANPDVLERRAPAASARALLLSPFDNLVIHRDRVQSVFDFDYQIECYLKEEDRRYG
ncbi:MAG: winged helix-turn-helix domain-containing protein [Pseudomonadales bacterium]